MQDVLVISKPHFEELLDAIKSLKILDTNKPELLSINESCKYLKCSKATFWKIRKQADIKAVFVGKRPRFRKSDLFAYLKLTYKYHPGDSVVNEFRKLFQSIEVKQQEVNNGRY